MRDITSTWTRPLVDSTTFHTILGILFDKKSRITLQNDTLAQSASQVNAISCNGEARGKQADQGGVAGASEAAKAAPTICTTSNHRPTTKTTTTMMTDEHVLFSHRTSDSTYRIPTPPRIVVPPPMLNANSLPQITLNAIKDASFLNTISYNNIITQNALLEWKYERRREAQLVLPYLFMGPLTAAKDEAYLRKEGITLLLGVRQKGPYKEVMAGAMRKAREIGIESHTVDLSSNQDLIHSFPETSMLIYSHVATRYQQTGQLGKALVFCESGNERSAGVVAAYLMETHEDVDYIKAMQLVQAQRFCVNFDDSMKRLLQGYWDILCARRAVAAGQANGGAAGSGMTNGHANGMATKPKRGLERDDDDMMEGAEMDDVERFEGRTFAPFTDQSPF